MRCFGRGYGWRCLACCAGAVIVDSLLSRRGIPPVDWLGPWQAIAVAIVAQYCDVSRAYASHHPPLFVDAVEWLCMPLRVVGEALAERGNAVAEGNVLPLDPRALLVPGGQRGHTGQPIAPARL